MAVLTDTKARAIKPGDVQIAHGGVTGLALEPTVKKGHGKWILRYVSPVSGKRRKMGLGSYPEVSIAKAAELGRQYREQIANGFDPIDEKNAAALETKIPSFQTAAELVHQELLPSWKNEKHGCDWINSLKMYVFTDLGSTPISDVMPKDVANVLRPIWLDKPETACRVKQRMHAVMGWAWAHGFVPSNPVDVVHHLLPKQGDAARAEHQPAMPWQDVPKFVAEHLSGEGRSVSCNALLFLILTAVRSGELRGATWDEINFEAAIWTIPAERMKTGVIHRVPLSEIAVKILKQQRGAHNEIVFPSPRAGVQLSDNALTMFLRKHNAQSDIEGRTATAHGFRSSFRDWASNHQYPRDWAERALAHAISNKVEAAYHRTDLLDHRRGMMQAWSDFVMGK
ncbi:tyrosine-type recombinase/integrase [Chitinibacter fontanus]|uniref:Tyrosine-type recombinase/integrase n=1 Tax=Chitinibacter fontanus TaxID=1737446 RepID=A0A7D5Z0C4_9NEIS|nr:site-specific integrase [Chitinibacter fontanus]QLI80281.1 tyrosine-type recombinase/integrase [Chitinibacter fontanus]